MTPSGGEETGRDFTGKIEKRKFAVKKARSKSAGGEETGRNFTGKGRKEQFAVKKGKVEASRRRAECKLWLKSKVTGRSILAIVLRNNIVLRQS